MPSTPAPKEADLRGSRKIEPDVAARADKEPPKPAQDGRASAPHGQALFDVLAGVSVPSLTAMFRAAVVNGIKAPGARPAVGKWARRARVGLLIAICGAAAAAGWARYGAAAKAMAVSWAPNYILASSTPQEDPAAAEQPNPPVPPAAAADPAAEQQPVPAAQATQTAAASVAALAPESVQLLQSMSQQIEQLKASIEQLKTGQEQIFRGISETKTALARNSEPDLRPMISAPPPRSALAPTRQPRPAFAPGQTAAAASIPPQPTRAATRRQAEPVLRPPMPIHTGTAFP